MTSLLATAADVLAGVLGMSFIEYAHHRWGGHATWMGRRVLESHGAHHRDPREGGVTYAQKLRQRLPLVVGVTSVLVAALWPAAGGAHAGRIALGLLGGYAYTEWYHHRMHHRAARGRFGRWMRRHHYVHHFVDARVNFGFTTPLWDWLLGTARDARAQPAEPVARRAKAAPTADGAC
jgi:dihydroceramide fatty acyl 2-hydroxylase